jgi:hypothetical protein
MLIGLLTPNDGGDTTMLRSPFAGATAALLAAATLLVACGGDDDPGWSAEAIAFPQDTPARPVLVNSGVGMGEARLAFAVFTADGTLVNELGDPVVRLYQLDGDEGTFNSEHALALAQIVGEGTPHAHEDGSTHLHDGPLTTVFATTTELPAPEWWGAELSFDLDGEHFEGLRLRLFVQEDTPEPAIGEAVPASEQLTVAHVDDIALVDTSPVPNPALHDQTVAEALANGRPSVIAFATPLFCRTRFCGPVVEQVVTPVWRQYEDRVNVMAIEPFDVALARENTIVLVPAMLEWGLQTEPWIFVVGADGRVVAKFEGIMSLDEVSAAVERALAAS